MTDKKPISKARLQMRVVAGILIVWVLALVVAVVDGDEMLKAATPIVTMAVGWLFAQKATNGQ